VSYTRARSRRSARRRSTGGSRRIPWLPAGLRPPVWLWPAAVLMVCAGFALDLVVLSPGGGSSTVSARPAVVAPTAPGTSGTPTVAPDAARALAAGAPASVSAASSPPAARVGASPAAHAPTALAGGASTGPGLGPGAGSGAGTGAAAEAGGGARFAAGAPAGNPFAGTTLYVDPSGDAAAAARTLQARDPDGARTLSRLADHAHADWFGDADPAAVRSRVADRVRTVRAAGALPVLVAYAIPQRDCGGGQSTGGVGDAAAYHAWLAAFAAGLGGGPATVIVEPDALAQIDCLSSGAAAARYAMLNDAVDQLAAAGATVYLDAGNATWHSAADMAARLRLSGVARARGFALNVSNFDETADETAYGDAIVAALGGGAHFVVDTSRNGRGPTADNTWCNPAERGLGPVPTSATGDPRADAFLWIKVPGESDGACNGGPPAGQWWLDYAMGLASRAA
jgi:endoglucanase